MYSKKQLQILIDEDEVLYFDATGCVVIKLRDVPCCKPLWYVFVLCKDEMFIPIAELISEKHDSTTIGNFIANLIEFAKKEGISLSNIKVIVIDWSWASIIALNKHFNNMNTLDYLNLVYDCLVNHIALPESMKIIHSCCAHMEKRGKETVRRKFNRYMGNVDFFLDCLARMILSDVLEELDIIYEAFITTLLTTSCEEACVSIAILATYKNEELLNEEVDAAIKEDRKPMFELNKESDALYKNSKFYQRYFKIWNSVTQKVLTEGTNTNKYYCPELAEYVTHSYMPYACMWTGVLLKEKVPSKPRLSNGTVEGFFGFAKTSLFREPLPMPISHFVLGMMSYVNRVCKVLLEGLC